jgi:Spy/CpxP family protein refolding chaperone
MQNSKTKSEAGLLVLVVFILGVLVGGVGYRLWGFRVFSSSDMRGGPPPGRGPQGPSFSQRMGLSTDQQKQLDAIFSKSHPQFQSLDDSYHSQRNALREQVRQQIRAILTPEQQTKFDAMTKDDDARGRGRGPGGPGGPDGPPRLGPPPPGIGSGGSNQAPNQQQSQSQQQAPAQH